MADLTPYSARWTGPVMIHRGADQTLSVSIEHGGSAPTVSAVTFSLFDSSGNTLLDDVTGSESAGVLSYTILTAITTDKTLGPGYLVRFKATIGGDVHPFYNDAALCLARLYPPIGTSDLTNRYSRLATLQATGASDLQKFVTDAWTELTNKLYSDSLPFWRMRTPSALREWLLTRALVFALRDLGFQLGTGAAYLEEANRLEKKLPGMFGQIRSLMDADEDNQVSQDQQSAGAVLLLSSGRISSWSG